MSHDAATAPIANNPELARASASTPSSLREASAPDPPSMVEAMKSANVTFGGTPSKNQHEAGRPSESHSRLTSAVPARVGAEVQRGRWARCEDAALPEAPSAEPRPRALARPEEPRTGVVRRMNVRSRERESGLIRRPPSRAESVGPLPAEVARAREAGTPADWRCLEWGQASKERRPKRNSKVTIVQLSNGGDLVRQNGPDTWLPEAGDFVHRMSQLVAQGLGFERCRSVCLRSPSAALSVTLAGDSKVVAVSGPLTSMTHVLRRAGLE